MDKREALKIYLKVHDECLTNNYCKDCVFSEPFKGEEVCIFDHVGVIEVAKNVRDKLNRISEAPEQKPSVPLENVGGIIVKRNEHTRKLIDEAIKEHSEKIKDWVERGNFVTEIVIPKGVERGVLPSSVVKTDNVNHPKHYLKGGLECIQVIKAQLMLEQYEGYLYGNVIKYMWRWQDKNGLEDLRKAAKYLEWLIVEVEN